MTDKKEKLDIGVSITEDRIFVDFDRPVIEIELEPKAAIEFGNALIRQANAVLNFQKNKDQQERE